MWGARVSFLLWERAGPITPIRPGPMQGKTVLVIEDNDDSREIYRSILEHHGFRVRLCVTAEDGLGIARRERPDIIMMDLGLPEMDGVSATRLLKSDPETAAIPVLVITVHAQPGDLADAHAAGCDEYIVKPADPSAVAARLAEMLGDPAAR